jgi:hypothetical protein
MIELIFAILVMAIALLSVPAVMQQASEADVMAVQQEAVMLAATQIAIASTLRWDENSTDGTTDREYIMDASDNSGRDGFGRSSATAPGNRVRIGTASMSVINDERRLFHNTPVQASTSLGSDTGETSTADYDDVDDLHNTSQTINATGSDSTDYKLTYTVSNQVDYVQNTAPSTASSSASTHIKRLNVNVRSSVGGQTYDVNMSAFFSNIGSVKYGSRF